MLSLQLHALLFESVSVGVELTGWLLAGTTLSHMHNLS
jgi:hypothetical protein